jgi:hypothetical protein
MLRNTLLALGTFVLMLAGGTVAAFWTIHFLMSLGLKYHDNYERYGQMPTVLLVPMAGIIGFVTPGIIVWRLRRNGWRVRLRTLLITTAVVAMFLGLSFWAAR